MEFRTDQMEKALNKAMADSLENMVFLEIEDVRMLQELPVFESQPFVVEVGLLKPVEGALRLFFEPDFAKQLFTDMTGQLPERNTRPADLTDALSEVGNTITGRFLASLLPPESAFKQGLPCCRYGAEMNAREGLGATMVNEYNLEGQYIYAALYLHQPKYNV